MGTVNQPHFWTSYGMLLIFFCSLDLEILPISICLNSFIYTILYLIQEFKVL